MKIYQKHNKGGLNYVFKLFEVFVIYCLMLSGQTIILLNKGYVKSFSKA